jgi:methionyl aminopeptidase
MQFDKVLDISKKSDEIKKTDKELFKLIPDIEDWLLAGRITAYLLQIGKENISKESKLLDIANLIENQIIELNKISKHVIKLAFPVNMSLNNCAAHYSAGIKDKSVFGSSIIKLDIGVNVNGAIGDAAITIDLTGKNKNLASAVEEACLKAIEAVRPSLNTSELGKIIETTIKSYKLNPIKNLGGHQINRYNLHAGVFVPNYKSGGNEKIEKGDILAIEPFASTGKGIAKESGKAEIFMISQTKKIKDRNTKKILNSIDYFDGLPFSGLNLINLSEKNTEEKVNKAIAHLLELDMLYAFPPLSDSKGTLTSQFEHTVIVGEKAIIITIL